MNPRTLRIFAASVAFTLFLAVFLGDQQLSTYLSRPLIFLQFTPSLLQFIAEPGHILGFGFVFLIITGFIFGRVYCSFLCPLGILQDLVIHLGRRWHKGHAFQESYPRIRYGLLALTAVCALLGSFTLLNLLDPFSLFGRLAVHPFKAMVLAANNVLVDLLEQFDIFTLKLRQQHVMPFSILIISLSSFGIIAVMAFKAGRAYCNSLCPVGVLLGLVARVSLFRFHIDRSKCRSCRACETVCKAGCIDMDQMRVDHSRCVACFNCLQICKKSAVTYSPYRLFAYADRWVPSKRSFLISTAAVGGTVLSAFSPLRLSAQQQPKPIMPPGAQSMEHFTRNCSACHLCVSVCPTNVITPAYMAYGLCGIMQPRLDYQLGHCDYGCNACGRACPTGAIKPLLLPQKRLTRIGTVHLNKLKCIVHVKKKHCGACGEACPTHAIYPVKRGQVLFPYIKTDFCVGCGACQKACPTTPKAIFVISEPVHSMAKRYMPPATTADPPPDQNDDFPF